MALINSGLVRQGDVKPETKRAPQARRVKKGEFIGWGAVVQLVGLGACFAAFPLGLIFGVILLVVGGRMAFKWRCGACGNRIDKESRLCPTCKIELVK